MSNANAMKYINEFRDGKLARQIAARIHAETNPDREYRFMEFCGGHTHAIARYGITELLPPNVQMIHGPGCPVCVLPIGRLDQAIALGLEHDAIVCTYGDTMRVPASKGLSLMKAKALGADIRMVYSALDCIGIARAHPDREVVFFAIGFETTTPPTALLVKEAHKAGIENLSVLCCHVLTPSAIAHILNAPETQRWNEAVALDGFIGPAHVSVVIGSAPYKPFTREYRKPVVIAGFEPLDVAQSILMLIRQVNEGRHELENEFIRAVTPAGNPTAIKVMAEVFECRESFEWRGLGTIPASALKLKSTYSSFDAKVRFNIPYQSVADHKGCECGAILRGVKKPTDCKLFGTVCTPDNAVGSCMVSSEGSCAAYYTYGRFRDAVIASN